VGPIHLATAAADIGVKAHDLHPRPERAPAVGGSPSSADVGDDKIVLKETT
jgi:hypothetical protein